MQIWDENLLKGRNIALGITGSISAYKSAELIRLFKKAGANIKTIQTDKSQKFISPIVLEALSGNIVINSQSESWSNQNNHIDIRKWADIFIIAPMSANSINKMANGIADNILLDSILAYDKPLILAPSCNTKMLKNTITLNSINKLQKLGHIILQNDMSKELACGDIGEGALEEPLEIFYRTAKELLKDNFWSDKLVIITGGGSIEKIDDFRFISNFSSGKQADALCLALYFKGANVEFISSKFFEQRPKQIKKHKVNNASSFYNQIQKSMKNSNKCFLFMAAAICDFKNKDIKRGKIKKDSIDTFALNLTKNIDILGSLKTQNIIKIGFKAEDKKEDALSNAQNMLKHKNLNAVCLNVIDTNNNFGDDTNNIQFITNKEIKKFQGSKFDVSLGIIDEVQKYGKSI